MDVTASFDDGTTQCTVSATIKTSEIDQYVAIAQKQLNQNRQMYKFDITLRDQIESALNAGAV